MSELIPSEMNGEPHADTIEIELTDSDFLPRHATGQQASSSTAVITQQLLTSPELRRTNVATRSVVRREVVRVGGALAVMFFLVVLRGVAQYGGLVGVPTYRSGRTLASLAQMEPEKPREVGSPVRMANPFDSSEVFEFPPGTSRAEARESVASLLLQRARDRRPQWGAIKRKARQQLPGDTSAS